MLRADDLWFRYGDRTPWVVRGVDLQVEPGQVIGIRGPSGTGKTTLGRLLAGYLRPDRGRVEVDGGGAQPSGASPVQLVLQHPELAVDPRWRLRESLAEAGAPEPDLLADLSIDAAWLGRFPGELSGGELQRLAVARALTARPRVVIADEISAMLDPITQAQLWHALLARVHDQQLSVIAISHDDDLLAAVADDVLDLGPGEHRPEHEAVTAPARA
ncbi:ABC transporter ATP-binding protein [Nitriliruptor alkaliphilus]|uniref:ABC transporter ATP-binding protein n=1 Tax=Nitriliruptor alkaliphilus TaxID=427918 RepID=UPI0006978615|nr:ATP-binding cassette domain-containing protein [Nitriliruptor alkaliphilus]